MLTLYDSLAKKKRPFTPINPESVTMYVCGPTVYNHPHIGNARPAVVFDVMARLLRKLYPKLTYVRNITDVDDKINAAAAKQGVAISEITTHFTQVYHDDLSQMGCLPPDIEPTATGSMAQMIDCIARLIDRGHAYESARHVLFAVDSCDGYGALSGRTAEENQAGARVEVADYKKNPFDFVLWKPATPEEPGWDSPWGRGRPGWHIECTAMIEKHIGLPIDIHGGGGDLQFPHHENERAQGMCLHGSSAYANYWVHNGMIRMGEDKMSKSLGNILLVKDLLADMPGEVLRLVLLQTHYRQPLLWQENSMAQAKVWLDKVYRLLAKLSPQQEDLAFSSLPEDLQKALLDDMNTPQALGVWYQLLREESQSSQVDQQKVDQIWTAAQLFGLGQQDPHTWFVQGKAGAISHEAVEALIAERGEAKQSKDYARADAIRAELVQQGIILEDSAGKTTWRRS